MSNNPKRHQPHEAALISGRPIKADSVKSVLSSIEDSPPHASPDGLAQVMSVPRKIASPFYLGEG
jgi:hypothetical protein